MSTTSGPAGFQQCLGTGKKRDFILNLSHYLNQVVRISVFALHIILTSTTKGWFKISIAAALDVNKFFKVRNMEKGHQ